MVISVSCVGQINNINHMFECKVQPDCVLKSKGKSNKKVEEKGSITSDATTQHKKGIRAFSFHTACFWFLLH